MIEIYSYFDILKHQQLVAKRSLLTSRGNHTLRHSTVYAVKKSKFWRGRRDLLKRSKWTRWS
uniref:Uncharacterized protein n=1 Tax=Lepeophtheirus salmonis TaxID=72036 RepID=A0A0K2UV19_LEPSM